LIPHEEEEATLAPWGLSQKNADGTTRLAKELLPKILITDPAVQAIKETVEADDDELPAGWLANRVVRVVRFSRSAGSSTAYRLIVESA
jgi:DNA-directed RNA polymerase subunit H (RpoH/RPB5)